MLETQVSLHDIGMRHGTDKAWCHGYTHRYAPLFEPLRDQPIRLLELGVKDGASLRMWREYFPNASIFGLDINPVVVPNCTVFVGDQADPLVIGNAGDNCGPFDVIIDDASHISSKTIASFELLWPHLRPGGVYAIEDTHAAYHEHFYGHREANQNPDAPTASGVPTIMQYLRRLADEANFHGTHDRDLFPARYWKGFRIDSICFTFNLAIICKSVL
jgi:8-demethyl-8-(2-methoxy-alpha-L-rhamnosyl)tetracenomycin-C 3'-O-methyltransferase